MLQKTILLLSLSFLLFTTSCKKEDPVKPQEEETESFEIELITLSSQNGKTFISYPDALESNINENAKECFTKISYFNYLSNYAIYLGPYITAVITDTDSSSYITYKWYEDYEAFDENGNSSFVDVYFQLDYSFDGSHYTYDLYISTDDIEPFNYVSGQTNADATSGTLSVDLNSLFSYLNHSEDDGSIEIEWNTNNDNSVSVNADIHFKVDEEEDQMKFEATYFDDLSGELTVIEENTTKYTWNVDGSGFKELNGQTVTW